MVSSMAFMLSFGPDSTLHHQPRPAVSSSFHAGCCSDGGCAALILASYSPLISKLPQWSLGRKGSKKCLTSRDAAVSLYVSTSRHHVMCSSKFLRPSRRLHCSAESKTIRTVEDDLERKSLFRPVSGCLFSAGGTPDIRSLRKVAKDTVMLPYSGLALKRQDEDFGVPNVFNGSEETSSANLYREWIATEFRAAVQSGSSPPRQKQENSECDNYYVNTGYAIRTLREELPDVFYKKLNFDIYRGDIIFKDPMNVFSGIDNYKLIFWALRFHGRVFFKSLWVDIGRIWQPHDKVIVIRWTVKGIPRVPWEAQGQFEGTSVYKLDKYGKIYEHKVDNVIFNSPPAQKYQAVSVLDLVRVDGAHTNPTPSFYGQVALLFAVVFPYLQQFTWVRFYWALTSTLALNNAGESFCEFGFNA